MDVLRVRVAAPDSPTVALWERHPAHPGGEVWLSGAGEFDVAATPAVLARLRDGRLVAVESVQEEESPAAAPPATRAGGTGPEVEAQQAADGRVLPAEQPEEEVSVVTTVTAGGPPTSRVNKRPARGNL